MNKQSHVTITGLEYVASLREMADNATTGWWTSQPSEIVCKRNGCGLPVMREGQHNHILDCGAAARARVKELERKIKQSL